MRRRHRLGDLQLAIMQVLWERGEATVGDVHAALVPQHGLALTTIATMLRKMEGKGVVSHRAEGRQFVYRPLVAETAVQRSMVGELTERLFQGDVTALVSHLLTEREIDFEQLDRLKMLIEARQQEARHGR